MSKTKTYLILVLVLICALLFTSCGYVYNMEKGMNELTSDEFAGRQAGSKGGAAAAKYIQDEMDAMGVKNHMQTFNYITYAPDSLEAQLVIIRDGTSSEKKLGIDFTPTRISSTASIKGSLTFDRNDPDLAKKILVTDQLFSLNELQNSPLGILYKENSIIKRIGIRDTALPVFSITKELYEEIAAGGIAEAQMNIGAVIAPAEMSNVIGLIEGKNRESAVIISAHYDGCGYDSSGIFKGAVDNASGVVALLKAAQTLQQYYTAEKPECDIVLAAFDGEETGLIGSQYYLSQCTYKSMVNINIDCIEKGKNLAVQSEESGAELAKSISQYISGSQVGELSGLSDNMVFSYYKVPAVLITTLTKEDPGKIHQLADTPDYVDRMLLLKLANNLADYVIEKHGGSVEEKEAA